MENRIYQIIDNPEWWFKSNNWKRMHDYPMLHKQKQKKYHAFKKKEVKLFEYLEEMIEQRLKEKI